MSHNSCLRFCCCNYKDILQSEKLSKLSIFSNSINIPKEDLITNNSTDFEIIEYPYAKNSQNNSIIKDKSKKNISKLSSSSNIIRNENSFMEKNAINQAQDINIKVNKIPIKSNASKFACNKIIKQNINKPIKVNIKKTSDKKNKKSIKERNYYINSLFKDSKYDRFYSKSFKKDNKKNKIGVINSIFVKNLFTNTNPNRKFYQIYSHDSSERSFFSSNDKSSSLSIKISSNHKRAKSQNPFIYQ